MISHATKMWKFATSIEYAASFSQKSRKQIEEMEDLNAISVPKEN